MNYDAFYAFSYGLYVVGTAGSDRLHGYIANTAFQVTAEPPQIAISCHKDNGSRKAIQESGIFSISVLHEDVSKELVTVFGYQNDPTVDRFAGFSHMIGVTGAPILLEDTIAYFECRVVKSVDIGSHFLFIGQVEAAVELKVSKEPMTYRYYRKTRKAASPKNSPTYQAKDKLTPSDDKSGQQCWLCPSCGYIYDPAEGDPDSGIAPGTSYKELPNDWICPVCGISKESFIPYD